MELGKTPEEHVLETADRKDFADIQTLLLIARSTVYFVYYKNKAFDTFKIGYNLCALLMARLLKIECGSDHHVLSLLSECLRYNAK